MRFPIILAVAALALAGCNANQGVSPSSQGGLGGRGPAPTFRATNAYDPTKYAQTSGFYAGGGGGR